MVFCNDGSFCNSRFFMYVNLKFCNSSVEAVWLWFYGQYDGICSIFFFSNNDSRFIFSYCSLNKNVHHSALDNIF